ncbi:MAG: DUF421 domain-containing protein [Ruminiclostridium sp.]|nr:DUF421 domain-containing protein [Ruminiclostridium sp.]MBR4112383.1 DUF421 domain-containing protein [Ruminiclostridium sp.]
MLTIIIRSVILFILVIAALRLMGKKQLGELQPSELVTTILISNIATLSLEDQSIPMILGIVPILMIVCIDVLMSGIMLKSVRFRKLVTGSPRVIITDGVIDQKELKNLRYTIDDVLEAMRDSDIFDITHVRYAIVETTGKINFFRKDEGKTDPPGVIIKDGLLIEEGLVKAGLGKEWLYDTLKRRNTEQKSVFLLTACGDGSYTMILKEGRSR